MHRVGQCNLISMVAKGFGATIVVGPLSLTAPYEIVLVPLAGRNVLPLCAVWMESNPNPALKALLDIVRESGRTPRATLLQARWLGIRRRLARTCETSIGRDESLQHRHDQTHKVANFMSGLAREYSSIGHEVAMQYGWKFHCHLNRLVVRDRA